MARKPTRKSKKSKPVSVEIAPGEKRATGRPKQPFRPDAAEKLLELMAEGRSIRSIVDSDPDFFPSRGLIWEWRQDVPEFESRYQLARLAQVEAMFDDTIHITDTAHELSDPEKAFVMDRVRVRQWYIPKANPKTYGDRIDQHVHTKTESPIAPLIEAMTPAQREMLRELLEGAREKVEQQRTGGLVIEQQARRRA